MIAWPNYPGRPELLAHSNNSNEFKLVIKLHPPDYLGGITEELFQYDVYVADSANSDFEEQYSGRAFYPNLTVNINLNTNVHINGGVDSLLNTYRVTAQLEIWRVNQTIQDFFRHISALPRGSPSLVVRTFCELIG